MTPAESVGFFLCRAGRALRAASVVGPRAEARLLLGEAMGVGADALLSDPRAAVAAPAAARFAAMLRRRLAGEPMAYILGRQGFWTLDLAVSPATLIPRADSEALVEAVLAAVPDRRAALRVLDLGTGTGALLLAILSEYGAAWGVGVDSVAAAAALARGNATAHGLGGRAAFLVGDWGAALAGPFDVVLSNPPYIERAVIAGLQPEVAGHEPRSALDGGVDGLDAYRAILAGLPGLLAPGGLAVLELGLGQGPAVSGLAATAGLGVVGVRDDLGGVPRAMVLKKPVGGAPDCA